MYYSIYSQDVKNSHILRNQVRAEHIARLSKLKEEKRLLIAGPNPSANSDDCGFTGSIVIAKFDSLKAAQNWANEDPYFKNGVYAKVEVKPFKKVLP